MNLNQSEKNKVDRDNPTMENSYQLLVIFPVKISKKSLQQLFVYILSFFIYFITKVFEKEDLIIIELKSRLRLMNESPKVFHFLSLLFW